MISADDYENLLNAKKESETKIESYKQCIAGYESRIKELTEERDKLKDQYRSAVAKKVLNSAYGAEQDICCRISKNLDAAMLDKIISLSDEIDNMLKENEKLKKESAEKSEWLKAKNEALDKLTIAHNKLVKEYKELKAKTKIISVIKNEKYFLESCIGTQRSQLEEYANKTKELRQKYEAVLKANEKLAAENSYLTNDPEITRLNNELKTLKKRFIDLDNAYKSQRNELLNLKNKPDDKYDILRKQYNSLYTDYELAIKVCEEYEDRLNKIESLANV